MYQLLKGLTVVEHATFIAGPSCGLHLAQMGASVIRIDNIGGSADSQRWPVGPHGQSLYWEGLNKGKRSIAINLDRPEGRKLAQQVATAADGLVVTNLPTNSYFSFDTLAAMRSNVICLRIMGWPNGRTAVDYTVNAATGVPVMTGHSDDARPVNHVVPGWDLLAGAYGAFAMIAAERQRQHTGRGYDLRLALSDIAAASLGNIGQVAEVFLNGVDRPRSGNSLFGAFGRDFVTADGERIMLVAITRRQWTGLVDALAIGDPLSKLEIENSVSFADDEGARFIHRARINAIVETAVGRRTLSDLSVALDRSRVTWSIYRTLKSALEVEPHLFGAQSVFQDVTHSGRDRYPTPGAALRIAAERREPPPSCRRLGEDTEEVLTNLLCLSGDKYARLRDTGIVS